MKKLATVLVAGFVVCSLLGCDRKPPSAPATPQTHPALPAQTQPSEKSNPFISQSSSSTQPVRLGRTTNMGHIVYVANRSGAMVDCLDWVKNDIMDSISTLKNSQDFDIMFFGLTPWEMPEKKLLSATASNMVRAGRFLENMSGGGMFDPEPSLKRAFDLLAKADDKAGKLICFATDGDFGDHNASVLALIKKLNANKEVIIDTYLYGETEDIKGKELLQEIASDNGGTYKFLCTKE